MGARGLTILSRGLALLFLSASLSLLSGCIVETAETGEEIGQVEGELSEAGDEAGEEQYDFGDIDLAAPEGSPDNGDGTNPEPQPWHDKTTGAPGPDPGPDPMVQSTKSTDTDE